MPLDVEKFFEQVTPPPTVALCRGRLLSLDPEAGRARMAFEPGLEICNPAGVLQGGFLTVMLDDVMSLAVFASQNFKRMAATLEMKANFIRPVFPGAIEAEGEVLRAGREVAYLEGRLFDGEGRLAVTASATSSFPRAAS